MKGLALEIDILARAHRGMSSHRSTFAPISATGVGFLVPGVGFRVELANHTICIGLRKVRTSSPGVKYSVPDATKATVDAELKDGEEYTEFLRASALASRLPLLQPCSFFGCWRLSACPSVCLL